MRRCHSIALGILTAGTLLAGANVGFAVGITFGNIPGVEYLESKLSKYYSDQFGFLSSEFASCLNAETCVIRRYRVSHKYCRGNCFVPLREYSVVTRREAMNKGPIVILGRTYPMPQIAGASLSSAAFRPPNLPLGTKVAIDEAMELKDVKPGQGL